MLIKLTVVVVLNIYTYHIIMLHALNLYNATLDINYISIKLEKVHTYIHTYNEVTLEALFCFFSPDV